MNAPNASSKRPASGARTDARRRGFSLLEVLVALSILTLGITSVIGLFTAATAAHRRAIHRSHASALAEWALADIESALELGTEPEKIIESPPVDVMKRDWPGYSVEVAMLPIAGETGGDEILVEVSIVWQSRGDSSQLDFQQIVVRRSRIR